MAVASIVGMGAKKASHKIGCIWQVENTLNRVFEDGSDVVNNLWKLNETTK